MLSITTPMQLGTPTLYYMRGLGNELNMCGLLVKQTASVNINKGTSHMK